MFKFDELLDYANSLPLTKWSVLKITAKFFDPLGLLGPFVIWLKIMFRKFCVQKVDWDDLLQDKLLRQWKSILAEFKGLKDIKIDRCYFTVSATPINVQLHEFCDSSIEAYAAVVCLQAVYPDKSVSVSVLASKTRVSPQKPQTIPHLSAVILSRLVTTIRDCLSFPKPMETFLWTDSTVVLCWLQSHKPCKQYVSSHINKIRKLTSKEIWHHCPGALNPADIPSRGMKGTELV